MKQKETPYWQAVALPVHLRRLLDAKTNKWSPYRYYDLYRLNRIVSFKYLIENLNRFRTLNEDQ